MIPESTNPLEEYKICQEKTVILENYVWKTAAIFGIGSFVGIVSINLIDLKPELSFIIGLIAIGFLFTWWRIARRWWSIEHATLFRMRKIEEKIGFQPNLIIENIDKKLRGKELSEDWKYFDFGELPKNHEFRGVQPMIRFFISINILSWFAFILFQIVPDVNLLTTHWFIVIVFFLSYIVLFSMHYRK